nr:MAG TPA: alpha helical recognition lobe domain protein [Caudoviricetes sp.]
MLKEKLSISYRLVNDNYPKVINKVLVLKRKLSN